MWGNPKLVTWDFGKDINVTLEDAVISWEEMRILLGGVMNKATEAKPVKIRKTAEITIASAEDWALANLKYDGENAAVAGLTTNGRHHLPAEPLTTFKWVDMTRGLRGTQKDFATNAPQESDFTDANGNAVTFKVRLFWEDVTTAEAKNATEIVISPDRYPGTLNLHMGLLGGIKMPNQFGELLEAMV